MTSTITVSSSGSFDRISKRIKALRDGKIFDQLDKYGREGAAALAKATPVDSSLTANSWTYEIINKGGVHGISWQNTNVVSGAPLAILLQYGHGTGTGGYVKGRDYINPVIKPLFERIRADVRKAVTSA